MGKRKINGIFLSIATFICFSFCTQISFGQTVKTVIDKNDILIGEPIKIKVTANFSPGNYKIDWLSIPDSIAHFEIVDRSKIDTVINTDNSRQLEQTITFTSFDSGRWTLPSFPVKFDAGINQNIPALQTDSFRINVDYAKPDSSNELRDIKPIIEVTVKDYFWYYIAGAALLLLIIGFILWRYLKNRKKEVSPIVSNSKLSPYDEAMQNLDKLKQLDLNNAEEVKKYHAGLSEIFKWFISRKQRVSIMNKTTGDILVHLADNNLPKENITTAATALRIGDAVKFAKYLPPVYESEQCLTGIKETINYINNKTIKQ
ncbi:MAG: hypothetical protein WDM90_13180 [Ferruginibacter sp.]